MKIRRLYLASECLYAYGLAFPRFVLCRRRARRLPPRLSGSVNVGGAQAPLLRLLRQRRGGAVLLREQWRPIKETIMHCIGGPN